MINVIVSSLNPAKIKAVDAAFSAVFPDTQIEVRGVDVPSDVAAQPLSAEETLRGARNRVMHAKKCAVADYYVGIEAGIEATSTFAWMVIDSGSYVSETRSATCQLPPVILDAIAQGKELGEVMDSVFGEENIKQKGGAIGIFTQHLLTRSDVYQQALILALIPFMHKSLYNPAHSG